MASFLGWQIIRIDGSSMSPLLEDGDYALARRYSFGHPPEVGDIAFVQHPHLGPIVKKIKGQQEDGSFTLIGTGTMTTASVDMGSVHEGQVISRVKYRIRQGKLLPGLVR